MEGGGRGHFSSPLFFGLVVLVLDECFRALRRVWRVEKGDEGNWISANVHMGSIFVE